MRNIRLFITVVVFSFCCIKSTIAAEYRLYAAAGIKIPLIALSQTYQTESGHSIVNDFDTAGAAEKKFLADPNAVCLYNPGLSVDSPELT